MTYSVEDMLPVDESPITLGHARCKASSVRTIHADVHRHESDIHLVPHSGPEHLEQDHSLIRLIDDGQATNILLAGLRGRLAAGERLTGVFAIERLGFCRHGLLNGRLVAVECCTSRGW